MYDAGAEIGRCWSKILITQTLVLDAFEADGIGIGEMGKLLVAQRRQRRVQPRIFILVPLWLFFPPTDARSGKEGG